MDPRTDLEHIKRTWRPPKDLERSRPREVRMTGAGKALAGAAIVLLVGGFCIGLALYAKASRDQENRSRLLDSGKDTNAFVARRWTSGRDPVRYWAEYVYHVQGRPYSARLQMGRKYWLSLESIGTLSIRYLPEDPQRHFVHGREAKLLPLWVSILVTGGLFFVAWLLSRILAGQRRLLAEGRPAPAVVAKIARTEHGKVAHYVFMTMSGKLIKGKSNPQKSPPAVGSVLSVIYEPDRETHSGPYPLSLVRTKMN